MHKNKIGNYFLFATALLLFSPFISDLGRPLNNPNTLFENYPIVLQEAYAEAIGFQPYTERLATGSVQHSSLTSHTFTSLPEFIKDQQGKYVNAIVTQD